MLPKKKKKKKKRIELWSILRNRYLSIREIFRRIFYDETRVTVIRRFHNFF